MVWWGDTATRRARRCPDARKGKIRNLHTRWQKVSGGLVAISAEWYSTGKVTINRAVDVDEVMLSISDMANRYEDAILEATKIRDNKMGAFELDFTQTIDLDAFAQTVSMGRGTMNLWLVETESESDFSGSGVWTFIPGIGYLWIWDQFMHISQCLEKDA